MMKINIRYPGFVISMVGLAIVCICPLLPIPDLFKLFFLLIGVVLGVLGSVSLESESFVRWPYTREVAIREYKIIERWWQIIIISVIVAFLLVIISVYLVRLPPDLSGVIGFITLPLVTFCLYRITAKKPKVSNDI